MAETAISHSGTKVRGPWGPGILEKSNTELVKLKTYQLHCKLYVFGMKNKIKINVAVKTFLQVLKCPLLCYLTVSRYTLSSVMYHYLLCTSEGI